MKRDAFDKVTGDAYQLWHGFIGRYSRPDLARFFAIPDPSRLAPWSRFFYEFVAEERNKVVSAVFQYSRLSGSGMPGTSVAWNGRPASWLFHLGGNVPAIIIDIVEVRAASLPTERRRMLERLVLHETGHLALHWDDLVPRRSPFIGPSTAVQEEEAWLFAKVVCGLMHSWVARDYRDRIPPQHDDTWLH